MSSSGRGTTLGLAAFVVIGLTAATCGVDEETSTTITTTDESVAVETTEAVPQTTAATVAAAGSVGESGPATTTAAGQSGGDLDCLDFWSEEFVQTTAGPAYTFDGMNNDGTLCAFTAPPNSIGVFFRPGDQALFDETKSVAGTLGGVTELDGVCDGAYSTELGATVAEGFSAAQGRIFNATIFGPADPMAVARELLMVACEGPAFG